MPTALRRKALPKPDPQSDPRFRRVMEQLRHGSARIKSHPPAAKKAHEAAAAAKGPPHERLAAGQAKQVDKIEQAPAKKPEKESFLSVLRAQIQEAMPKTLGDTEKFMKGGSKEELKGSLQGNINQQKDQAESGVKSASKEPPKETGTAKEVKAIPPDAPVPAPPVDGPGAMPAPKSDADVSLQDSKADADQQLKAANVTTTQLQKANDPRFSAVLGAKDAVGKQADAGPGLYRAAEKGISTGAAATANATAHKGSVSMVLVKHHANSTVLTKQQQAKLKDEQARQKVVQGIEEIYNRTKTNVENKLASLEKDAGALFDTGVDAALQAMTDYVEKRISDYKWDRYISRIGGSLLWIKDQFVGLPDEVNAYYESGRALFTRLMDAVVVRVANLVEQRLKEAKDEVAKGQADIQKFVDSQPKELRAVAQAAQKDVAGRFDELQSAIEDKKNSLAQQLAQKYKEAFDKANEALKKIQDANKGLVQAFVEKLGEVIKILLEFKSKLMSLLKKGAEVIGLILSDPIGFLGNLIGAIKLGIQQFVGNIWKHLKQGFMTWLFGALAESGIEIPSDLSLVSILKLVLAVLGITYDRMRAKAVKLIGERAVKLIEKLVEYVKALITGGPAKLWEMVKEDLSNLKAMVIDAIQNYLIETVIKQAVMKLISMFNPAGAIVQAVIAIYNTVTFLIEKATQIMTFVEAVINSVAAIAQGAIAGAANWIENALAKAIPLVIGFLAQLIGLGGLSKKIREFIEKVQNVVDKAIDKAIAKVVSIVKKLFGKLTGKDKPDERTDAQKKADLDRSMAESTELLKKTGATSDDIRKQLPEIRKKYNMSRLELVTDSRMPGAETDHIEGAINPDYKTGSQKLTEKQAEYEVGTHPVAAPTTAGNTKGESHHIPFKVLKRWFGEILILAGAALAESSEKADQQKGAKLAKLGNEWVADVVGDGLSAIWLSEKAHHLAHAHTQPGELSKMRTTFIVRTADNRVSSRPTRGTIARTIYEKTIGQSTTTDRDKLNEKIFAAKAQELPTFFGKVAESMLNVGIALVKRVPLKDEKWEPLIRAKKKETWDKKLKW